MHQTQRQQTRDLLKQHEIDQALFANPESVTWLTGFAPPPQVGAPSASASYPLVWYADGHFTLIALDSYKALAASFAAESDGSVLLYSGRQLDRAVDSGAELLSAFWSVAQIPQSSKVGVERTYVSDLIAGAILADAPITSIDSWLEPLRMIKTAEELATLRYAFSLTDRGHAAARKAIAPGLREIDIWNEVHSAIQAEAGERIPLGNDCVVNTRSFNEGGWPGTNVMRPGDSLIVDLSAIVGGYWSDSCATYYVTERTAEQEKAHRMIQNALDFGISLVKPGAVARDIDQQVRKFIRDAGYPVYGHHTGHAVGASGHEAPRIVPYNTQVLEAGMVIMLEPGTYTPGQIAVRLEDAMLVTADGAEVLTKHDKS